MALLLRGGRNPVITRAKKGINIITDKNLLHYKIVYILISYKFCSQMKKDCIKIDYRKSAL